MEHRVALLGYWVFWTLLFSSDVCDIQNLPLDIWIIESLVNVRDGEIRNNVGCQIKLCRNIHKLIRHWNSNCNLEKRYIYATCHNRSTLRIC